MTVKRQQILNIWKQAEKEVLLEVCSNSMRPTLNADDFICLRLSDTVDYKTGDIVVFERGKDLVVHRIVKQKAIDGDVFFCEKGDNTYRWSWVARKDLLGRVVAIADKDKVVKRPQNQFRSHNRLMGFLGGCLVTFYEALKPINRLAPELVQTDLIVKLKHLTARLHVRLLNFIGTVANRT